MKYRYKVLIQIVILFYPFWLIINGFIGVLDKVPLHPDDLIFFGVLIIGLISMFNILLFMIRLFLLGWHEIGQYYKIFFFIHLILFIPSFTAWLVFLGVINPFRFF
ncbi:hypothetical protein FD06_GL001261 [Apilactobacillus ozensis DSM 23829 = JCM 17196]|uniref:Integral membrane protein n=1 Tax=Apilactobacillus ozensis DSM 23829 = JCM 17196 TaxID=1423781 RepID=A0A0R2AN03_9LACO|nr:hypothetical protein [Apilactobacillus ozensis]KRM68240.1 hypothetical protein FD06_GL001261 [Apilactobacillus ozensis DSM 23829 = JCM 17196]